MSHVNNTTPREWQDILNGLAKRKQDRDNATNSVSDAPAEPGSAASTIPAAMAGTTPAAQGGGVPGIVHDEEHTDSQALEEQVFNQAQTTTANLLPGETTDSPGSYTSSDVTEDPEYDDYAEIGESLEVMDLYAKLNHSHYGEVEKMLLTKMEDIKTYEKTKNHAIQHLDWSAGNPEDPAVKKALAFDAANPEKTTDTANREKIAQMVARITFGVKEEVDLKKQFSKTMHFGDWLASPHGEKEYFVEIHVKRIQGNDLELLDDCGVSTRLAFLPLADLVIDADGRISMLDAKNGVAAKDAATDNDEAKPSGAENEVTKAANKPVIASGSNINFSFQGVNTPGNVATANTSMARPVIMPGCRPVPAPAPRAPEDDPRTLRWPGPLPSTEGPRYGTPGSRVLFRRDLSVRYDHLESFVPSDPQFSERVNNSFVYVVKVMGIPVPVKGHVNTFTGPEAAKRVATLLGMGGWIVPSMEERVAFWAGKGRKHHPKPAKKYEGLPKPAVQRALPAGRDRTDVAPPGIIGDFLPLWMELCDPTLEDVYWMVWQLFAGKKYIGVRCGGGFGLYRHGEEVVANQGRNPFKSPSPESIYHTANWKLDDSDEKATDEKVANKKAGGKK